jgi:magnesium transporter
MWPLIMKGLGIDPATSSTPFIASMSDVLGVLMFVHVGEYVMAAVIAAKATGPIQLSWPMRDPRRSLNDCYVS